MPVKDALETLAQRGRRPPAPRWCWPAAALTRQRSAGRDLRDHPRKRAGWPLRQLRDRDQVPIGHSRLGGSAGCACSRGHQGGQQDHGGQPRQSCKCSLKHDLTSVARAQRARSRSTRPAECPGTSGIVACGVAVPLAWLDTALALLHHRLPETCSSRQLFSPKAPPRPGTAAPGASPPTVQRYSRKRKLWGFRSADGHRSPIRESPAVVARRDALLAAAWPLCHPPTGNLP